MILIRIRDAALIGISMALAACSTAPAARLFTLDANAGDMPAAGRCDGPATVEIVPVDLPEYADHDQFTRRAGPDEIVLDDMAHWAERPSVAIARLIAGRLRGTAGLCADTAPASAARYELRIVLDRFEFAPDGAAVAGTWRLVSRDSGLTVTGDDFAQRQSISASDPAADAAAMSGLLTDIAGKIAVGVRKAAVSHP